MRRSTVLLLVPCLFLVTSSYAEIVVTRDRFNGTTSISTKIIPGNQLVIAAITTEDKRQKPLLFFLLHYTNSSWVYLQCHHTYWLADGVPVPLPESTHKGSVGNGHVIEQIQISPIDMQHLKQLARARQVEYKICNDEYKVTAAEMEDIRAVLSYVQKAQREESVEGK